MLLLLLLLLLIVVVAVAVESKKVHVQVDSKRNWVWLDRFCFEDKEFLGTVEFAMWVNKNHIALSNTSTTTTNYYLMAYYGKDWDEAYSKQEKLSCQEKADLAFFKYPMFNGVPLLGGTSGGQRPRFYYYALVNCNVESIGKADVEMRFLNEASAWQEQFSYDEMGLFELYSIFFLCFAGVASLQSYSAITISEGSTGSLHPVVRLITISLTIESLSMMMLMIHYGVYSENGHGSPGLLAFGNILDITSDLVFLAVVILLSRGWTISESHVRAPMQIYSILFGAGILYLSLYIYEHATWDPASEASIYETSTGIVFILYRVCIMLYFIYNLRQTYLHETRPETRRFYYWFGIAVTLWFASLPFIVTIAAMVDPWVRVITISSISLLADFFTFLGIAYIFWPSRIESYFKISHPEFQAGGISKYDEL